MPNKVVYSSSNALQMFLPDFVNDTRYNSKDFEDWEFPDTILPFEQLVSYCQPWQLNDSIPLQLLSNLSVNFILKNSRTDAVIDTIPFDNILESAEEPGLFIREVLVPLAGYPEGLYYVELDFGGVFSLRSGDLNFAELHEGTILAESSHYENREDIYYETGFVVYNRIESIKKFDRPSQKATVYEDQVLNLSSLRSTKYRLWNWLIAGLYGIPDYRADQIGGMIGNSTFKLDGKYYTVAEGEEMEPNGLDLYPMRGWSVKLRERFTRGGKVFENDIPVEGNIIVMSNVDMKGFNMEGSQTIIIDVQ